MSETGRIFLCLLSMLLAFGLIAISDGWRTGAKLLHMHYPGMLTVFLLSYALVLCTITRGGLIKSYWLIAVTTVLAYPVAFLAYVVYFAAFENARFINTLRHPGLVRAAPIIFVFLPTISIAWLFGALVGIFFLASSRVLRPIIQRPD
jgi:hypothetical protein